MLKIRQQRSMWMSSVPSQGMWLINRTSGAKCVPREFRAAAIHPVRCVHFAQPVDTCEENTAKAEAVDVAQCLTCPKGREFVNRTTECEVCAAGDFKTAARTRRNVLILPGRSISRDDGKTHAHEHLNASQCLPCDPGMYATSNGSASCAVCPGGQYTDANTEANPIAKSVLRAS